MTAASLVRLMMRTLILELLEVAGVSRIGSNEEKGSKMAGWPLCSEVIGCELVGLL